MSFLYEGNTIPRTHPQHQGHLTITIKDSSHPEHASTQNTQMSSCLPSFSSILQKIYQELRKNSQTINAPNLPASKI